jgi:hypothetical protein
MIPNLTIIVAVYVVIRLAALVLRQFPAAERSAAARYPVAVLSALAIVLAVICTLDTIGVGLSIGSTIEAKHAWPVAR